jgi:diguanylate cyclase (GGDEF)-like protein/PAS domain S-box-containing protein
MGALTLTPEGPPLSLEGTLTPGALTLALALVTPLVLVCGLMASLLDSYRNRQLEAETRRLRRLLDATFEGILIQRHGVITEVNAQLCALLGRRREALIGKQVEEVLGPASHPAINPSRGPLSVETEITDAAGETQPVEVLARALGDPEGGERVMAVRGLTERKLAEQRIAHFAQHDALTGLANRGLFGEIVRRALAHADRTGGELALVCLDLDGFRVANDVLGLASGDLLLAAVAARLRGTTRKMDAVARIGGDEFAILQQLRGAPESTVTLAERIIRELSTPFEIGGQSFRIGASVGIALYPEDARTLEELLRKADLALYRAKQQGKGVYRFFEPVMDAQLKERRELELDLRGALANNEFTLDYQGLFDAATLATVGYEALLRWQHPRRGRISPTMFVPIAEASGLIHEIGAWVLETACREAAGWGPTLRLSVNLSPAQFKRVGLFREIRATLDRTGLAPGRLELEITESLLIDDTDRALAVLNDLKSHGVRLSLDDFGTGYSSLSYLRRFPFDTLKIDQSFVQAIGHDDGSDSIVRAVIALGRSLGLEVIAEGVETPQQLGFLRGHKCQQVQGYLLARPMPAADLPHMVAEAARA